MATREECDKFYRSIGLPGFHPGYNRELVLSRAESLPESQAAHVRRCLALTDIDCEEYFDISEYATHPDVVSLLANPNSVVPLLFLLHQSDNPQFPFSLHAIDPKGYTFHKYHDWHGYQVIPMKRVDSTGYLHHLLGGQMSNIPKELVEIVVKGGQGAILCDPALSSEDGGYMDVILDNSPNFGRWVNCLVQRILFPAT